MVPRFISNYRGTHKSKPVKKGDYVVATKYGDGDPGDQFCIGTYDGSFDHFGEMRHLVLDNDGKNFRHNGFRRVERVTSKRGAWLVAHLAYIEKMQDQYSVWHWVHASWAELNSVAQQLAA